MDAAALRARRAAAQLLHRPGGAGAAEVVRALLAVQAQEARAARLALRARSEGLTTAAGGERRLRQEGVSAGDAERAGAIVERALGADGPLTRAQLAERIAAAGIRTAGQATPHLLGLAARRGVAVLGPVLDGERAFVLSRDW